MNEGGGDKRSDRRRKGDLHIGHRHLHGCIFTPVPGQPSKYRNA